MSKKKVYCKNCRFHLKDYKSSLYRPLTHWCSAEPIYEDKYNERIKIYPIDPVEQNKDNDCSLYERKWYKFWIKE